MYGKIINEVPDGFVPYHQLPECNMFYNIPAFFKPERVGVKPLGARWRIWPICLERYVSDIEPDIALSRIQGNARNRLILWNRVLRTDIPQGWHQFSKKISRLEGFASITPSKNYWEGWSKAARQARKKWLEDYAPVYTIESVLFKEFAAGYRTSTVSKKIGKNLLRAVEKKKAADTTESVELRAVRDPSSRQLIAGMALIYSPAHRASYYECGFISPEAGDIPAMVGLMDDWFARSISRGITFLHFGSFWTPGLPSQWKGFSLFKSKFGLQYVAHPPTVVRFVRGSLW